MLLKKTTATSKNLVLSVNFLSGVAIMFVFAKHCLLSGVCLCVCVHICVYIRFS